MQIEAMQNNWEDMRHIPEPCTFLKNPTEKEKEKKNVKKHLKMKRAKQIYKTGIFG